MGRGVMAHPHADAIGYRTLDYGGYCDHCGMLTHAGDDNTCDDCGNELEPDEHGEFATEEFNYLVDWIREEFTSAFPSMDKCDYWAHGAGAMSELRCVVENQLCSVYVAEYCGMVSINVVPTGEANYWRETTGIARTWCEKNATRVLDKLNEYQRVATMSNGESVYERASA